MNLFFSSLFVLFSTYFLTDFLTAFIGIKPRAVPFPDWLELIIFGLIIFIPLVTSFFNKKGRKFSVIFLFIQIVLLQIYIYGRNWSNNIPIDFAPLLISMIYNATKIGKTKNPP